MGTTSILSLQSAGSLLLSFGTLTLTDTTVGNESNATNFTQSAGTLDGAAVLVISGSYTWTGGAQQGSGTTRIAAGGTLTKSGSAGVSLNTRTLRVEGSVVVDGTVGMNRERGDDRDDRRRDLRPEDGRRPERHRRGTAERFLNAGTLTKSGGTAESIDRGRVGQHKGTVTASAGHTAAGRRRRRRFADRQLHRHQAPGTVEFGGGIFDVAVATTATLNDGVEHSFGTLEGAGTWRVNGAVTWTGGTLGRARARRWSSREQTLTKSGSTAEPALNTRTLARRGQRRRGRDRRIHPERGDDRDDRRGRSST